MKSARDPRARRPGSARTAALGALAEATGLDGPRRPDIDARSPSGGRGRLLALRSACYSRRRPPATLTRASTELGRARARRAPPGAIDSAPQIRVVRIRYVLKRGGRNDDAAACTRHAHASRGRSRTRKRAAHDPRGRRHAVSHRATPIPRCSVVEKGQTTIRRVLASATPSAARASQPTTRALRATVDEIVPRPAASDAHGSTDDAVRDADQHRTPGGYRSLSREPVVVHGDAVQSDDGGARRGTALGGPSAEVCCNRSARRARKPDRPRRRL